jgi:hypothetical protein
MKVGMGAIHFGDIKNTRLLRPIIPINAQPRMKFLKQVSAMNNCLDGSTGDQKKADAENET